MRRLISFTGYVILAVGGFCFQKISWGMAEWMFVIGLIMIALGVGVMIGEVQGRHEESKNVAATIGAVAVPVIAITCIIIVRWLSTAP